MYSKIAPIANSHTALNPPRRIRDELPILAFVLDN